VNDSPVIFRPAIKADCGVIAQIYQISFDGVADYIWSKIATADEDILDVGRRRHERENKLNLNMFEKNSGAKRLYAEARLQGGCSGSYISASINPFYRWCYFDGPGIRMKTTREYMS
jgi:hypothetical protein